MKSLLKKSLYKTFVSLFIIFYSFIPQSIAIGQTIEDMSLNSEGSVTEEVPLEQEIVVEEETTVVEVTPPEEFSEVSEEDAKEIVKENMSSPVWIVNGNSATTSDVVKVGKLYIAPQNSDVQLFFTELPSNPSKVTIKEISLTSDEIEATGAVYDKAYDITTDMVDGTFEYDLTLPLVDKNSDVAYVETRALLAEGVTKVQSIMEKDSIKVKDLNHFTLFILVSVDDTLSDSGVQNEDNVWVSDNQYARFNNSSDNAEYSFPDIDIPSGATVDGISVLVEGKTTGRDIMVSLFNQTSDAYTSSKTVDLKSSEGVITVGGENDKWGKTWSENDFDSNFKILVDANSGGGNADIDNIQVKVFYTEEIVVPSISLNYDPTDSFSFTSISGVWTSTDGGSGITGLNSNEVRWGTPADSQKSGLRFDGSGQQSFDTGESFYLGALTHMNWPVYAGTAASGANLEITLDFEKPDVSDKVLTYDFDIEETSNSNLGSCPSWQQSSTPCDDRVTFPSIYGSESFQLGDKLYTLEIVGFVNSYPSGNPVYEFITEEYKNNTAYLVGRLSSVLISAPQISLVEKAVNGDDADLTPGLVIGEGNTVNFTYSVQNTGNVQIIDIVVQDDMGVVVTCPKTTLEAGESMICVGQSTAVLGQYTNNAYATGSYNGSTYTSNTEIANYYGIGKVTICHATNSNSNPYITNTPDASGDVSGHDSHNGPVWFPGINVVWGDIIPPFVYPGGTYPGKNWDTYGQSVWSNGCQIPQGSLTVHKVIETGNDNTSFDITASGTPLIPGSGTFLDNDNTGSISRNSSYTYTVMPGTYDVSESIPSGWTLVSNTCTGVTIANGEDKECTINNANYGSLTIVKDSNPDSSQNFSFTTSGQGLSNFSLDDDSDPTLSNTKIFTNLLPGTYSVTENSSTGWSLTNVICSDQSSNTSIDISAGESVTCLFTNTKLGSISGYKYNDIDGSDSTTNDRIGVSGWTIELWKDNVKVAQTVTDSNGYYLFTDLLPGNYVVKEGLGTGWYVLYPTSMEVNITLDAGESDSGNNFVNVEYGSITIEKVVNPILSQQIFNFTVSTTGYSASTTLKHGEKYSFNSLKPGSYNISETFNSDYFTTIVCDGISGFPGSTGFLSSLRSGQDIYCTFTNTRKMGTLKVIKDLINDNGGTLSESDFTFTINGSTYAFESDGINEIILPTGTYSVIENSAIGYGTTYNNCSNVAVTHDGVTICTITNDDIAPRLTVVKNVLNDSDGELSASDFTINIMGTDVSSTSFSGSEVGTTVTLDAGSYSVSEIYNSGDYIQNLSSDCTGTIGIGQEKTCIITNSDIDHLPEIQVTKSANKQIIDETGEFVVFTFKIDNNSLEPVTVTELTDSVFGVLSGESGCQIGTQIPAGGSCSFDLERKISGDYGNEHTNIFSAKVVDNEGNEDLDTDDYVISFKDVRPNIYVIKTANIPSVPETGGDVTFSYMVVNRGSEAVSIDSMVDDKFPSLDGDHDCYVGRVLGAFESCSFDETMHISGIAPDIHNNIFTVVGVDDEGNQETVYDDASVQFTYVPSIQLIKEVVNSYNGNASPSDWMLTAIGSDKTISGVTGVFDYVTPGIPYTLSESNIRGYESKGWSCTGGNLVGNVLTLAPEDDVICTVRNEALPGTITVYKEVVNNDDASAISETEFVVTLSNSSGSLGSDIIKDGSTQEVAIFNNLNAGIYNVNENNEPGFINIGCHIKRDPIALAFVLPSLISIGGFDLVNGQNLEIVCENEIIDPVLNITKENNTTGIDRYASDIVEYTINVMAPIVSEDGYVLKDVELRDLLPGGFEFIPGSGSATKNGTPLTLTDPVYSSVFAVWSLGDMKEGDKIVLKYSGKISFDQDPGLYKDIAWVRGTSLGGDTVLGNVDTGVFVGTKVNVISKDIDEGEVLGASTTITLPRTGASSLLTLTLLVTMIGGFLMMLLKPKTRSLILSLLVALFIGLSSNIVRAQVVDILTAQIEEPATPINKQEFKIGFTVANTSGEDITVKCIEKTQNVVFDIYKGINTGSCVVDDSVIPTDGTYIFYIEAGDINNNKTSKEVPVEVDFIKPSSVKEYEKTKSGCLNILTFKTADDGQTSKIQIFRSEKSSFIADSSNILTQLAVLPNENVSYTDGTSLCDVEYYYAIRALDNSGNASSFVSDDFKVYVEAEDTVELEEEVVEDEETKDEEVQNDEQEEASKPENNEEGEIKGEEDIEEEIKTENQNTKWLWWQYALLGAGVVLSASMIVYLYVKNRKKI